MCSHTHRIPSLEELSDVARLHSAVNFKHLSPQNVSLIHRISTHSIAVPSDYFTSKKSFDLTQKAIEVFQDVISALYRQNKRLMEALERLQQHISQVEAQRDEAIIDVVRSFETIKTLRAKSAMLGEKHTKEGLSSTGGIQSHRNRLENDLLSGPLKSSENGAFVCKDCEKKYTSEYSLRSHRKKRHDVVRKTSGEELMSCSPDSSSSPLSEIKPVVTLDSTSDVMKEFFIRGELNAFRNEIEMIRSLLEDFLMSQKLAPHSISVGEGSTGVDGQNSNHNAQHRTSTSSTISKDNTVLSLPSQKVIGNVCVVEQRSALSSKKGEKEEENGVFTAAAYRSLREELSQQRQQIQQLCRSQEKVVQDSHSRKNDLSVYEEGTPDAMEEIKKTKSDEYVDDKGDRKEVTPIRHFPNQNLSFPFPTKAPDIPVQGVAPVSMPSLSSLKVPLLLSPIPYTEQEFCPVLESCVVSPMGSSTMDYKTSLPSPSFCRSPAENSFPSKRKKGTPSTGTASTTEITSPRTYPHTPVSSPKSQRKSFLLKDPQFSQETSSEEHFISYKRQLLRSPERIYASSAEDRIEKMKVEDSVVASNPSKEDEDAKVEKEGGRGGGEPFRSRQLSPSQTPSETSHASIQIPIWDNEHRPPSVSTLGMDVTPIPSTLGSLEAQAFKSISDTQPSVLTMERQAVRKEEGEKRHLKEEIFADSHGNTASPPPTRAVTRSSIHEQGDGLAASSRLPFLDQAFPSGGLPTSLCVTKETSSSLRGASLPHGKRSSHDRTSPPVELKVMVDRKSEKDMPVRDDDRKHQFPSHRRGPGSRGEAAFPSPFMPSLLAPLTTSLLVSSQGDENHLKKLKGHAIEKEKKEQLIGATQKGDSLPFASTTNASNCASTGTSFMLFSPISHLTCDPEGPSSHHTVGAFHSVDHTPPGPTAAYTTSPRESSMEDRADSSSPPPSCVMHSTGYCSASIFPSTPPHATITPTAGNAERNIAGTSNTLPFSPSSFSSPNMESATSKIGIQEMLLVEHSSRDPIRESTASPAIPSDHGNDKDVASSQHAMPSPTTSSSYTYLYEYSASEGSQSIELVEGDVSSESVDVGNLDEEEESYSTVSCSSSEESPVGEISEEKGNENKEKDAHPASSSFSSPSGLRAAQQKEHTPPITTTSGKKTVGSIFKHLLSKPKKRKDK